MRSAGYLEANAGRKDLEAAAVGNIDKKLGGKPAAAAAAAVAAAWSPNFEYNCKL